VTTNGEKSDISTWFDRHWTGAHKSSTNALTGYCALILVQGIESHLRNFKHVVDPVPI
jgi:hypothetical protein